MAFGILKLNYADYSRDRIQISKMFLPLLLYTAFYITFGSLEGMTTSMMPNYSTNFCKEKSYKGFITIYQILPQIRDTN